MKLDTIKTEKFGNITLELHYDTSPDSPRDWDTVGTIVYTSTRYFLGDECISHEEMQDISDKIDSGELLGLPVYAHIHGGVTLSTGSFSDPWDSGQCGYIYTTKEKARKEFGEDLDKLFKCLEGEIESYSQFLSGEVYGYVVKDAEGDTVDSCWGFYGEEDDAWSEGVSAAKHASDVVEAERLANEDKFNLLYIHHGHDYYSEETVNKTPLNHEDMTAFIRSKQDEIVNRHFEQEEIDAELANFIKRKQFILTNYRWTVHVKFSC